MARSQVLNFADKFKALITTAAWRSKPSWMLVAESDRTINPDLERGMPREPTVTRSKWRRQPLGLRLPAERSCRCDRRGCSARLLEKMSHGFESGGR